ncbi:class I SAM-dependent methyltransferase [Almyronema epifaneia]|uniref:Class I SAM-dependent methyltransferase n=1 Tax=Almyronema epifaneia S1 TaxID=2991925 RepID=A0ABW6IJQ2_9CYAN
MTAVAPHLTARLINGLLAIQPLASFAKAKARKMMIDRAESIGVFWRDEVKALRRRADVASLAENPPAELATAWETDLAAMQNPDLVYPDYYVTSFHAYAEGNLGWTPAMEVEVAARAVHARIWPEGGAQGDAWLRQSYHTVLTQHLPAVPQDVVDLGCGVGMSTFALQATFPQAQLTGIDLSPYFLAVAQYRDRQRLEQTGRGEPETGSGAKTAPLPPTLPHPITWLHAPAESTSLPSASFDLVSTCLMFHELPQSAAIAIIQEARRLLRPGGHLAIMDMNPHSEVFAKMPPFVLTLLKSTEPYLDQYFGLEISQAMQAAGFQPPMQVQNSPRHRTLMAQVA